VAIAEAHEQWIRAFQQHDPALIEPLLADEIVYHGEEPFTKHHLMQHVRDTSFALESVSPNELRVRILGSARDVAVVTGSVNAKGRRVGEPFHLQNRYTEVWVNRGGRWQCVAGQEATWPVKSGESVLSALSTPMATAGLSLQIDEYWTDRTSWDYFSSYLVSAAESSSVLLARPVQG
jgi:ketosteroid isomerase-like protein